MKKAFTMLELVFVIVVIGIISAMIAPSFGGNNLREAADQVISHIRYTQHLAMMDDKFDINNPTWFKERWQLQFVEKIRTTTSSSSGLVSVWSYTIFSDDSNHDANPNSGDMVASSLFEPVEKDSSGVYISGVFLSGGFGTAINYNHKGRNKKMGLKEEYGIQDVVFSSSCSYYNSKRLLFDKIGRPYYSYKKDTSSLASNPYSDMKLVKEQCQLSLCQNKPCDDKNITIAIEPETGYAHIL